MHSIADYLSHVQAPQYHNIPLQLKTGKKHLIWIPEERGDKIGKAPFNARALSESGKYFKASSTNERSWSSFPQAIKAYEKNRSNVGGIGRVLTDSIMLIDLDHSINHDTGEVHPTALEILAMFDTNAEQSPGNGIHIFPLAHLPEGANSVYFYKGIKVELYDSGRYTTITGIPIPGIPSIPELKDQQTQVNALVELLSQASHENTGVCVCVCGSEHQGGQCVCQQAPARDVAQQEKRHKPLRKSSQANQVQQPQAVGPKIREEDLPQGDQLVLDKARSARNAATFVDLWYGGDPKGRNDSHAADWDLILLLLYWTSDSPNHDTSRQVERIFQASHRYRPGKTDRPTAKSGRYTYLQMSIYNARCKRYGVPLALPDPEDPQPPQPGGGQPIPKGKRQAEEPKTRSRSSYQVIRYAYDWMKRDFDQVQWNAGLYALAEQAKLDTATHFEEGGRQLRVTALPPGTGKSHAFGELCDDMNLAVIVPRHELIASVPGYKKQRHIKTASEHNCSSHEHHHRIAALGYNTLPVHQDHDQPCDYLLQYKEQGSAMYQIAHSETCYIGEHDGIIIDEWNLPDWLHEKTYSVERLAKAAHQFAVEAPASRFLVAWQATLTDLAHEYGPGSYQGRTVLDLLNKHLWKNGRETLDQILGTLEHDYHAYDDHPWPASIDAGSELPEVLLPHIYYAALKELARWQRGSQDYNSCIRVVVEKKQALLYITTTRAINATSKEGVRHAIALADATAHKGILANWYGAEVEVKRLAQDPPPHMKHIHLAERCAKKSMQAKHGRDQARTIRKLKYFLKRFDPTGEKARSGKIGIITYMGNEEAIRLALDIPEGRTGHFWAMRGSNLLEACEILLIVGTPTLAPETMYRLARTVYRDDPQPIIEGSGKDEVERHRYLDYRVQELSDYLTSAELTQCAHRHRPLRYDGRLTISLCDSDLDYLPVTHFVSQMPRLTEDGEDAAEIKEAEDYARLDQARRQLEAQGIPLGVHRLGRAAGLKTDTAGRYLKEWRAAQDEAEQQANTHTHTHQCSHTIPETAMMDNNSNVGYENTSVSSESPPSAPRGRPGTATTPPEYEQPCIRCGHVDDWVKDPSGQQWLCSCYYRWYEHPERRGPQQVAMFG